MSNANPGERTAAARLEHERRTAALNRFERATEVPLLVLALLMVPLLLAPLALHLSDGQERVVFALDWLIWGIFAADLLIRTWLAPRKLNYLARHWFDVLIVVLPFLRPFRVARSAHALYALRALRVLVYLARAIHTTRSILALTGVRAPLLFFGLVLTASGIGIYFAERSTDGPIDDLGTAFWWAITTATTVGYGDTYPVTALGRGIGVVLMIVGIGTFVALTANVAAFLFESQEPQRKDASDEVLAELRRLHARLDAAGIADGEPAATVEGD